jgi:hypothetical protein
VRNRPLRYDWLAIRRSPRMRGLTSFDVVLWLLIEAENRRGPGCQLSSETMARRLGVSESSVKRSLRRWRKSRIILELWRPGLLPKLRLTFHPFDPSAVGRAARSIDWHGKQLGGEWSRGAQSFLRSRTRRIEAARLTVRRSFQA